MIETEKPFPSNFDFFLKTVFFGLFTYDIGLI